VTQKTFNQRLTKISDRTRGDLVKLMAQAGNKPFSLDHSTGDYSTERILDNICLLGAWMHDRLPGKTTSGQRTMTQKIRKALGYI
jgi:hypothetical protein